MLWLLFTPSSIAYHIADDRLLVDLDQNDTLHSLFALIPVPNIRVIGTFFVEKANVVYIAIMLFCNTWFY